MRKPELLLPAGNTEAFYAAIEGGADAVYLGLQQFNARGRADNFTIPQLQSMLKIAKEKNVRIYVTVNTVIKNEELPELTELLHQLSQTDVDAIIIQDWGVYHLLKTYFPQLNIHGSTQMGFHNSAGTQLAEKLGFERIILARELTMQELESIKRKSKIQLELFIHGALCYSFSGACLFSSYLGGQSANRGLCKQPCRRDFFYHFKDHAFFSLKDNQQLKNVPAFGKLGISSLKVEGRMKSPDYVYQVAQAYRKVLDAADELEQAGEMLNMDMSREKTSYFLGNDVKDAITGNTATGLFIGQAIVSNSKVFGFKPSVELKKGNRLRIVPKNGDEHISMKIREFEQEENWYRLPQPEIRIKTGDKIFLTDKREKRFPSKLPEATQATLKTIPPQKKNTILKSLQKNATLGRNKVYVRIDSLNWLRKIHLPIVEGVILRLNKKEMEAFDTSLPFVQRFKDKFHPEFPVFIPEKSIPFYRAQAQRFMDAGISRFSLGQLSQRELLPEGADYILNEYNYGFNDAALAFYLEQGAQNTILPLENSIENLLSLENKGHILPLYYRPVLFYSRMPVTQVRNKDFIKDDEGNYYSHIVRDGMTHLVPEVPVALFQYVEKLKRSGYRNYLLDVSFEEPSKHTLNRLLKHIRYSEQLQPSNSFNFKLGFE